MDRQCSVHVVSVDISAKVEHWALNSAIAVANNEQWVCYVPGKVKRKLRSALKERYGARNLQYRVFALLVYAAIRDHLHVIERVIIDQDYEGGQVEATIKNLLLHLVRRDYPQATAEFVRFANIKGSETDLLAKRAYDARTNKWPVLTYAAIEELL